MARKQIVLTALIAVILALTVMAGTASATTVDLDKWSGSITLANGGRLTWHENLGGVTNPSFEEPLDTGVWHQSFVYVPDHENVTYPIDYNVLYYDRSTDISYDGVNSFKFDFRWYTDKDLRFPATPDGYIWYYVRLWSTTSPADSASGNVKVLIFYWMNLMTYNWRTAGAAMWAIDTYIWVNVTYLDTSGVQREGWYEIVCHDANHTSTTWELGEATFTNCRRILNLSIELRLRLISTAYLDYTILAGSEIRLTWYIDMIVISEPKSFSQSPTATFTAHPNGNTDWVVKLNYPLDSYFIPVLTAYVPNHWSTSSVKTPTGVDVTSLCTRSSYNSTHDKVDIPYSVLESYGPGYYTLTFTQSPVAMGITMKDSYGTVTVADVGESITFEVSGTSGFNVETIIAYQDGTVYRDVTGPLPVTITMPSTPSYLAVLIRVWDSTHRTLLRRYFTCDKIKLELTFTRINATAVNMTVTTKSWLNGTVLTGATLVVNGTKKTPADGRLSEVYTLGDRGVIPVYAYHSGYLLNASDEYSFAWDGEAYAWGDANITQFTWDSTYLYEFLETEDLPSGTLVTLRFWRGSYDVDSVQAISGTLVGYTLDSQVVVRVEAASPVAVKVVLKTAGVPAPGPGGEVTGGEAPPPPPPPPEEEVTPPPTPPYVEVRPEWIVAFIIGSLLIYAIFRVSRRYTAATFTNYTCPYCGKRLEYAYLRRLGRTYLYCPRCRRFFVPTR